MGTQPFVAGVGDGVFTHPRLGFSGAFWPRSYGSRWRQQFRRRLPKWRARVLSARNSAAQGQNGSLVETHHGKGRPTLNEICVAAWMTWQERCGKKVLGETYFSKPRLCGGRVQLSPKDTVIGIWNYRKYVFYEIQHLQLEVRWMHLLR